MKRWYYAVSTVNLEANGYTILGLGRTREEAKNNGLANLEPLDAQDLESQTLHQNFRVITKAAARGWITENNIDAFLSSKDQVW